MIKLTSNDRTIVVIGLPASGKSFLADAIVKESKGKPLRLFRTDDYIKHGFEESLYVLRRDLARDITPIKLIEGVQGYRLLRKGLELRDFSPDLVITTVATIVVRKERYGKRSKVLNRGFDSMLEKIWNDYLAALSQRISADADFVPPRFLLYDTQTNKTMKA